MLRSLVLVCFAAFFFAPGMSRAQSIFLYHPIQIPVFQLDANTFEAIENDGAGGTEMWCAAAIFSRKVLRRDSGDIYVKVGRGPSKSVQGRKSVIFTTEPVEGAFKTYDQTVRKTGKVMSYTMSNAMCRSGREVVVRLSNGAYVYW